MIACLHARSPLLRGSLDRERSAAKGSFHHTSSRAHSPRKAVKCSGVARLTDDIVAAEAITKRFGNNQVLTGVTLRVPERQVVCVVGPSGSGKTTLLRCIALLEEPSDGRIVMSGKVISQ